MNARAERGFGTDWLVVAAAIGSFYGILFWAPLIYDDRTFILASPLVAGPWPGLKAFFVSGIFEPVPTLLSRLLYAAAGARPPAYRLAGLLVHGLNAGLVLALLRREVKDRDLALLGALLFALFPAHAEILAVSTFKTHLLAAFFILSALELLERRSWAPGVRRAGAWLLFAAALGCKETAVLLPALAGARWLRDRGRAGAERAAGAPALFGGWTLILAAYAFWRVTAAPRALSPLAGTGRLAHVLTSAKIFAWLAGHLILPYPLSLESSLAPVAAPSAAAVLLAFAGAAAALAGLRALYGWERKVWFGASWTALALLPFVNLVPYVNFSLVADRYLYLASVGFFLAAAELAGKIAATRRRRPWVLAALAALAAAYGGAGLSYAALFCDPRAIWENAARRAPDNPRARAAYGAALLQAGDAEAAAAELRRATALDPGYPEPYLDLADAYSRLGRPDDALAAAKERARLSPDASGEKTLGACFLRAGRPGPALEALLRARELAPRDPAIRLDLGYAELGVKNWDGAEADFSAVGESSVLRGRALAGLGEAARARGRIAESAALLERSLALDPWNAAAVKTLARDEAALGRKADAAKLYDGLLSRLDGLPPDPAADALRAELRRDRAAAGL